MSPILEAVFDREKTIWAHTPGGAEAERLLQRGAGAHLFDPDADLDALIRRVWTEGVFLGVIRVFERFALVSETPIGERIPKDSETLSLYCIEIKGRVIEGRWRYHLVPRSRPPESNDERNG